MEDGNLAPKAQKLTDLMFKDKKKFRRRRKEICVFDLKNVDFGGEIQLMVKQNRVRISDLWNVKLTRL